jgi:hypothetical protein
MPMKMFEEEVFEELSKRLRAADIDPSDPLVERIQSVVSQFFAERTAEVLAKVREVLDLVDKGPPN